MELKDIKNSEVGITTIKIPIQLIIDGITQQTLNNKV